MTDNSNRDVEIIYTLADGARIRVFVPLEVAAFLRRDDKRLHAQGRGDRRNLDSGGYVEGETELRMATGDVVLGKVLERERNCLIHKHIEGLPPNQCRVLKAYCFSGYKLSEIARHEGVHKSVMGRTLKRAKRNLRRQLKTEQLFSDGQLFDDLCPLI